MQKSPNAFFNQNKQTNKRFPLLSSSSWIKFKHICAALNCIVCLRPTFLYVIPYDLNLDSQMSCYLPPLLVQGSLYAGIQLTPPRPLATPSTGLTSMEPSFGWSLFGRTEDVLPQTCPHPCHFSNLQGIIKRDL